MELKVGEMEASNEMKCMFPKEYLSTFLSAGLRPDGRKVYSGRQATLSVGSVSTANGSALVRFGETLVVCGVKAELVATTPTSFDTPVVCNVEVAPCSLSSMSAGPPTTPTQALAQTLQISIMKCVEMEQMLMEDRKFHWVLFVDVLCLCDGGNVIDAACLAATAALTTTLLPQVDCSSSATPIVSLKQTTNLKLIRIPIFVSFALLTEGLCLLDPCRSEEELADGSISFCFSDSSTISQLTHTGVGVSPQLILSLSRVAQEQAQNLFKLLHEATN